MSDRTTSWRIEVALLMVELEDKGPLIACTLTDDEFDRRFDAGYGGTRGDPFTAWTETRVYFPVQYDGSEWVGSVPRNPCDEKSSHMGGG